MNVYPFLYTSRENINYLNNQFEVNIPKDQEKFDSVKVLHKTQEDYASKEFQMFEFNSDS